MKSFKYAYLFVLISLSFGVFAQPEIKSEAQSDFEILKNLELFELVYKNIDMNYVEKPNPGELMKTAIDAMLFELDPYTTYIPESLIEDYKLMSTGQYGGIGAIIRQQDDFVMIIDPHEGFPAQKSGLRAGDIFVEINGKSLAGLSSSEVSDKLKGKPGTEVTIKVKRKNDFIEKTMLREEIKFSPVPYYGMLSKEIGYIKLASFTQNAGADVLDAFKDLKGNKGMKQLVFDLRGNGGGLVVEAVKIVNMFVDKGTEIVSIKGRDESVNKTYIAQLKPEDTQMPIIVLVDGNSASASEIVSGALQDLDRAVIVGQTTFGKGLVQRPLDLKYNARVKVTIAKYYTPSGRCIQKLDYSHRKIGKNANQISDSLLHIFETKNGRKVVDGRGVEPDIVMPDIEYARLTATLVINNIIFDYVTQFTEQNATIINPKEFRVSDEIYEDFTAYAKAQDFEYSTASAEIMKQLQETAEDEAFYEDAKAEFEALLTKFEPSKSRDLLKFKAEIIPLIADEIVGRYYYQKGRIEHQLVTDDFIDRAIEILNDKSRYKKVLNLEN